jgi:large subunit ribosomal protein L9
MKVIMLKDTKGVGRAHEAIDAKDGYALNFLIPKKLAVPATPTALKEAEGRRKQREEEGKVSAALLAQNIAALADAKIVVKARANEKQHLYDAVGEKEIIAAVKREAKVDLPEGVIAIEKPFKELGTFDVPIASGETFGKFQITIEAEE